MNRIEFDGSNAEESDERSERERSFPIQIPVGVAFDIRDVVTTLLHSKQQNGEECEVEEELARKIDEVVPIELVRVGPEEYTRDLDNLVEIDISYLEVETIGYEAMALPTGREVLEITGIASSERAIFDALRNRSLLSALAVEEAFVAAGGKGNVSLVTSITKQLS